ncbi:MAG: ComEC/Rec2 family competence protein [Candidatus Omnitrophica bacterium]|nr:ComEC/Rec2 family competence protein [Candidatus Omnitrophota bacterium]
MLKTIFSGAVLNFWLFIAFACGIIIGNVFPNFALFIFLSLLAGGAVYFFYKKNNFFLSDIFVLVLFITLGAQAQAPASIKRIENFLDKENPCTLKVLSLPQGAGLRKTFSAQLKRVCGLPVGTAIKVIDYTRSMEYLNTYEVTGTLRRRFYQERGFYYLWVKQQAPITQIPSSVLDKGNKKIVRYILKVFKENLSEEGYNFLASVFLGRRELFREGGRIFTDAGIAHLLAISGSNIALTALVLFFILKIFYIKFRVRIILSLIFVSIYTVITGANLPTVRAVIMYAVFAAGFFLKRKVNPLNSLGLAGLLCLLLNPVSFFDVGFQLSFLSVFALIAGFTFLPVRGTKNWLINYVMYTALSSFYVSLLILPLVSYYFGRIYLLSILYNVVLIPFFTLILMVNFLLLIVSPLRFFAQSTGAVLSFLIYLFDGLTQFFGSLRFSFVSFTFTMPMVCFYYVIFAAGIIIFKGKKTLYARGKT